MRPDLPDPLESRDPPERLVHGDRARFGRAAYRWVSSRADPELYAWPVARSEPAISAREKGRLTAVANDGRNGYRGPG